MSEGTLAMFCQSKSSVFKDGNNDLHLGGNSDIKHPQRSRCVRLVQIDRKISFRGKSRKSAFPRIDNDVRPGMLASGGKNENPVFAKEKSKHCLASMTYFMYRNVSSKPLE